MKTLTKYLQFAVLTGALPLLLASAVAAQNPNPTVLPPNSKAHGMSCDEWGDAWWQWALSIPADVNPLLDSTGEFAAVGQSGSVWFLAGTQGGTVERTVTVPAGKALFFPIFNSVWVNFPELGDDPWSEVQEAFARALIGDSVDNAPPLSCEIDGRPVKNITAYRCQTPDDGEYLVDIPQDDIWGLTTFFELDPGWYGPSVSDGYFLMLAPLSAGQHTIHFAADGFLDVTYNITVADGD